MNDDSVTEPEKGHPLGAQLADDEAHVQNEKLDDDQLDSEEQTPSETGHNLTRVATAQDWSSPDDPENPQNWPAKRKIFITFATALQAFATTFGTSVYTPGYPQVEQEFHVTSTGALLGLSIYVLGQGLGPIIAAPISETFGRTWIYRLSIPISLLFTLGAGFSQTFSALIICRLFAGISGSPVLAVGAGTSSDMYPPRVRAIATSFFIMAPFLGPAFGPVVGGYTIMFHSWRWTQWALIFVGIGTYIPTFFIKETYKKVILQRRAKRLGIPPPTGGPKGLDKIKFIITVTLTRPIHMLLTEPIVTFLSLYTAFTFAVLFAFFAAFPIVFEGVYGFTPGQSGLTFLAVGLGVGLAVVTGIVADHFFYKKKYAAAIKAGRKGVAPEHRLYTAMWGSIGLPIGLFWLAWSSRKDVSWASPVVAAIPFAWGNLSIFLSSSMYLIDTYGALYGASAMAANGLLRYVLGAAFPLFTVQLYHALGINWATSLFGFISLLLLPIPWILFKYGPQIRARSQYETIKI